MIFGICVILLLAGLLVGAWFAFGKDLPDDEHSLIEKVEIDAAEEKAKLDNAIKQIAADAKAEYAKAKAEINKIESEVEPIVEEVTKVIKAKSKKKDA